MSILISELLLCVLMIAQLNLDKNRQIMLFEYNVSIRHTISHGYNFICYKVTEHVNVDGNNKVLCGIYKFIFDCPSHIRMGHAHNVTQFIIETIDAYLLLCSPKSLFMIEFEKLYPMEE